MIQLTPKKNQSDSLKLLKTANKAFITDDSVIDWRAGIRALDLARGSVISILGRLYDFGTQEFFCLDAIIRKILARDEMMIEWVAIAEQQAISDLPDVELTVT